MKKFIISFVLSMFALGAFAAAGADAAGVPEVAAVASVEVATAAPDVVPMRATGCNSARTSYGAFGYCAYTDGGPTFNYFVVLIQCRHWSHLYMTTASGSWERGGSGRASRAVCPGGYHPVGSSWLLFKT